MNYQILARSPNLEDIELVILAVIADFRRKIKQCKMIDKYFNLVRVIIAVEHEGGGSTHCRWYSWKI